MRRWSALLGRVCIALAASVRGAEQLSSVDPLRSVALDDAA